MKMKRTSNFINDDQFDNQIIDIMFKTNLLKIDPPISYEDTIKEGSDSSMSSVSSVEDDIDGPIPKFHYQVPLDPDDSTQFRYLSSSSEEGKLDEPKLLGDNKSVD